MNLNAQDAKAAAKALRSRLQSNGVSIPHALALEAVAAQLGFADWNTASAVLDRRGDVGAPVPVLRSHDEALARGFYVQWLGFEVEWEHRFEPGLPLYCRLRRGDAALDLSEHHGDGTPGTVAWIPVANLRALRDELAQRPYAKLRPGIDKRAPGGPTMTLTDPFGNVLRFCEPTQ